MNNYRFIHLLYVPTMACNMACKYCYLEDNTKDLDSNKNALDTLKYAVDKFFESKVIPFNMQVVVWNLCCFKCLKQKLFRLRK